uniref:INB domain-containing protein n=1 Tax=Parastrongyloides trichosuri TaxID=131310 RepID=A0A0N4ZE01_PARTI
MKFISLITFLLCILIISIYGTTEEDISKCKSDEAQQSCGDCIKQHPECAWCLDPRFPNTKRCNHKDLFEEGECAKTHIYAPSTEMRIAPQNNIPIGGKHRDGRTIIQLEPQQVVLRMKPGDIIEVPFKYQHRKPTTGHEVKDFSIQTSDFRSSGIGIEFFIECNGERIQGRTCPNIKENDIILFFAKVTVNECKNYGDLAVSVGIYGYNTVSALFVTSVCGCECEKTQNQDAKSNFCSKRGALICGACNCENGYGGDRCECEFSKYGVSSNDELNNKCKASEDAEICSGNGRCRCGVCQCTFQDVIKGRFCECDNSACPADEEGRLCHGRGTCECGKCICNEGYESEDCSCTSNQDACKENDSICSSNGVCECGKCICSEGFTGPTCAIESHDDDNDDNGETAEGLVDERKSKSSESSEEKSQDGHEGQEGQEGDAGHHEGKSQESKSSGEKEDEAPSSSSFVKPTYIFYFTISSLLLPLFLYY